MTCKLQKFENVELQKLIKRQFVVFPKSWGIIVRSLWNLFSRSLFLRFGC